MPVQDQLHAGAGTETEGTVVQLSARWYPIECTLMCNSVHAGNYHLNVITFAGTYCSKSIGPRCAVIHDMSI